MITHHRPFRYFRRIVTAALAFLAVLVLLPAALYVLYANDCDAIKGYHPLSLKTYPAGSITEKESLFPVSVGNLVMLPETGAAVLFLVTDGKDRYLPITIGHFEALAINRFMHSVPTPRPMTHELLLNMVGTLGGQIIDVAVVSLEEGTFRAIIRIGLTDGSETGIDARPSDAIALAIKAGASIYVAPSVMEKAGRRIDEYDEYKGDPADPWRESPEYPEPPISPHQFVPETTL
ncbi:MAG: bifunctional nuclease family protein [Syntrophales bacterium]|nr:bifunctional nuclease family protein [Syntrophales bacterium]